ncbi:MAG: YcgN family cysteine cluster protein [Methylococcaceae bacterium]
MAMSNFWEKKTLLEMSQDEWESLCDGCGKCCLHKLEDEDTGEIYITSIACKLLDLKTCRCTNYAQRIKNVPDCLDLRDVNFIEYQWLPKTCAYRLLHDGEKLPLWHPLISGNKNSVETVASYAISETEITNVDDFEDYVLMLQT